jgi:hypothetical protein
MASSRRTLLGTLSAMGGRQRVYETADALEIDEAEDNEIRRRKVYYDEILVVTYHRRIGIGYVIGCAVLALLGAGLGLAVGMTAGWVIGVGVSAMLWLPALIAGVLRLALGVDVVGVYGPRTRARLEFAFRKARAREVYQLVAARARQHQSAR